MRLLAVKNYNLKLTLPLKKKKNCRTFRSCEKFLDFRLLSNSPVQLIRIPLAPVIGFTSGFKVWETPKRRLVSTGRIAEASTGPVLVRWKMSDKTNGSIFGDGSILAIRRCTETNDLPDVYLLRRHRATLDRRNRASLHKLREKTRKKKDEIKEV